MAKLIFIDEKFKGQTYELKREKTTIGRGDQNHLIIPDTSVSIQHSMILANGPEVLLCELDSSNGTYVDGSRVNKQCQIKSGQTIRFGAATARLELASDDDFTENEEMTAVLGFRRALQKASGNPSQPTPETPATRLRSETPADAEEPTITLGQLSPPSRTPSPQSDSRAAHSTPGPVASSSKLWLGLGLVAAFTLGVVVCWLLWGKN
ncbi:MAG: FHA domain-containing protein [Verrucomicrobiales bacterium]|nr:FHA domain-containing protein [Verrucomicrobiales bacterium]